MVIILYLLKRLRGVYPKNPKIPGKGPMGGKPLLDGTRTGPKAPFGAKRKESQAVVRKRGHQYFLGETSGTTIVNDMQEAEIKRRTGEMRAIGGKTYRFEKRPSRC